MHLDDSIKKFLGSAYGEKIIRTAQLNAQENFKYGKKHYPMRELIGYLEMLKMNKGH